jgi:RNA polymerase sigma-70 factor (ECF subfamily)
MGGDEVISLEEFTKLMRKHQAGVRAYISSLGTPSDLVDDIAQESFLIAWNKRDAYDFQRDFGTWVRGIARNVLLRKRVADERSRRLITAHVTDLLAARSDGEGIGDPDRTQQLVEALDECMEQLPERSSTLLKERYEKDRKSPELAARLGTTADAIRQTFVRIRRQLRECIEKKIREAAV